MRSCLYFGLNTLSPSSIFSARARLVSCSSVFRARFATLAWSEMATKQAEYPYGLIAGGMGDGTVNVWDPAKLVASHPKPEVGEGSEPAMVWLFAWKSGDKTAVVAGSWSCAPCRCRLRQTHPCPA